MTPSTSVSAPATPLPALEDLTARLRTDLPEELQRAWRIDQPVAHQAVLGEVTAELANRFAAIGGAADAEDSDLARYVVFEWLGEAKEFLILLRNIVFEEQRAQLMIYEEQLTEEDFDRLKAASLEQAREAANVLVSSLDTVTDKPLRMANKRKEWRVQRSPWPAYQLQFNALKDQLNDLHDQNADLLATADVYQRIQQLFRTTFADYLVYLDGVIEKLDAALQVDAEGEPSAKAATLVRLVGNHTGQAPAPDTATEFIERLETYTNGLSIRRDLIAAHSDGQLLTRDINLSRATTNWVESELMNEVQDFYLRRGQIESRLQIAVQTGENRLEVTDEDAKTFANQDIPQTMGQLARNLRRSADDIRALETEVLQHLDEELHAYRVYDPDFLRLNMQQTLSQYRRYQESGWRELQQWARRTWRSVNNLTAESRREEELSFSERVVRLVRARQVDADAVNYSSMFLTKGYTGESFRVGREVELARVAQIVENWRQGFRGAVLITGRRMSGKTFFGELIAHRHFSDNFITLAPGVRLDLDGRILEPTRDLKAAVNFVIRYSARHPIMVWIDDLSNWRDEETPLINDVRALLDVIDYNASKFFFVVSCGSELHAQLRQHTLIDNHFQAVLPMPRMNLEDIQQAIFIRHGATQLQLVNADEEVVGSDQFKRLILPVYRSSGGHIGNALRQWAYAIERIGEESARFNGIPRYDFPDELSEDSGLLLRTILVDRITNEYQLRKQFGPLFRERFQPLIQRLLNLGVLLRNPNGDLFINPAIVVDVEVQLEREGFVHLPLFTEQSPV